METTGVIALIVSFVLLISIGLPIAYSLGIAGILTMLVSINKLPSFTTFAHCMATGLDSFTLLAIPFFILAGNLMNNGGIAKRLINFARVLVGNIPGGLAVVNVFANMLFGAVSGSAAAASSAIGSIMGPEMKKEGYDNSYSAAVNITSATTGLSIPPSNILIVYSLASGGVSITALFLAGYIPGILTGLALALMAVSMIVYKVQGMKGVLRMLLKTFFILSVIFLVVFVFKKSPEYFTKPVSISVKGIVTGFILFLITIKTIKKIDKVKQGMMKFFNALPSLLMLVIVIGGIVAGFFTATEASAIAVVYSFILGFINRELKFKDLPDVLLRSVKTTSIVMLLVATSIGLSWIMSFENIPQTVSEGMLKISNNPFVILLIINLILLVVGTFMDMTPAVLIFTPIFLPVVTSQLGLDPIHFGIVMVLNLSIGLCTPPVGSVLFIGCSVAGVTIDKVIKPLLPMFIAMFVVLMLVTYLPQLSLWLPHYFGF